MRQLARIGWTSILVLAGCTLAPADGPLVFLDASVPEGGRPQTQGPPAAARISSGRTISPGTSSSRSTDSFTPCENEVCVPGEERWCDAPYSCAWGLQECGPTGQWGACRETVERPGDCPQEGWYSEECCLDADACCQNYWLVFRDLPRDASVGHCADIVECPDGTTPAQTPEDPEPQTPEEPDPQTPAEPDPEDPAPY